MKIKYFLILLLLLCYSKQSISSVATKLPKLLTKQDLANLRFIAKDGRFTYYQMKSGKLYLSLNYKVKEILSLKEGTQYELISSSDGKYILLSADESFHTKLSLRKNKKIYILKYGKGDPKLIGEGNFPQFHLNNTWISYFDSVKNTVYFKNIISPEITFFLEMNNNVSKYYVPKVAMISKNQVLYSDINTQGLEGLLLFRKNQKKQNLIYKVTSPVQRLELCLHGPNLLLGEFNTVTSKRSSKIFTITDIEKKSPSIKEIYRSKKEDLGGILCNLSPSSILFIKDYSEGTSLEFDVAELNLKTKKLTRLSNMHKVFQFIEMDGRVLIPYRGEYYVVKGISNVAEQDNLKK